MSKVNLSPAFLLISIGLLFWAIVLTIVFGELPPLITLAAIASVLYAIYAELYYANRR